MFSASPMVPVWIQQLLELCICMPDHSRPAQKRNILLQNSESPSLFPKSPVIHSDWPVLVTGLPLNQLLCTGNWLSELIGLASVVL